MLPISLAALVYGLRTLVNVNADGDQPLDVPSVLLSVPGFGGIVFGLSRLGESSGSSAWVAPLSLVVGVVCLVLFGFRQRALVTGKGPLLDLRAFDLVMFRRGVALLCIAAVALFGAIILLPIYFQNVRGLNTLETGLLLLPGGLLMGLLGPVVGRLFDKHGPRALSTTGASLLVLTMLALTQVGPTTPVPLLLGIHLLLSTGLAFLFTPAFTTALNPLPPSLYSHGSAILSTLQQVSGAAGVALLVTIVTLRAGSAAAAGADADRRRGRRAASRVPGGGRHRAGRRRAGPDPAQDRGGGAARARCRPSTEPDGRARSPSPTSTCADVPSAVAANVGGPRQDHRMYEYATGDAALALDHDPTTLAARGTDPTRRCCSTWRPASPPSTECRRGRSSRRTGTRRCAAPPGGGRCCRPASRR